MMDNPQAFPSNTDRHDDMFVGHYGMTLRDYFAGQALTGYLASATDEFHNKVPSYTAHRVYEIADNMLRERSK